MGSEIFSKFWEDIIRQYPFLNFARINYGEQKHLIKRIPFGVREFPLVYSQSRFEESDFAEIFLRGNIEKDMKLFLLKTVQEEIEYLENEEYVENKNEKQIVYLFTTERKFPLIKLNYYIGKIRSIGWEVYFVKQRRETFQVYDQGDILFESKIENPKHFLPKLFDYLASLQNLELNQDSYFLTN